MNESILVDQVILLYDIKKIYHTVVVVSKVMKHRMVVRQVTVRPRHNGPKIGSRMEFLAKKMREQYIRDALYADTKIYLDTLRER